MTITNYPTKKNLSVNSPTVTKTNKPTENVDSSTGGTASKQLKSSQILATNTPVIVLSASTATPVPIKTATPVPTKIPITYPSQTPTPLVEQPERMSVTLGMLPEGSFTPNGQGNVTVTAIINLNGYWDYLVNASITNLWPLRNYQLWLCGINCSSNTNSRFTTTENGEGSINTTIGHNQGGDPINKIVIWEIPPGGEVPSDSTACFMISNKSIPCLKGNVSF